MAEQVDTQGLERNHIQVTCTRNLTGDQFPLGVQDFNFSIGGRNAFVPNKSYFRFGIKLRSNRLTADSAVLRRDAMTFADSVIDNLYTNVYFRAGGSDVSSIVSYSAQAGMLNKRLTKTGAWLNNVGKSAFGMTSSFDERVNQYSLDGVVSGLPIQHLIGDQTATVALTAANGVVAGANTTWDTVGSPYRVYVGDTLTIADVPYTVLTVTSDTALVVLVGAGGADITPTNNAHISSPAGGGTPQFSEVYINWVPPIGIFNADILGSGDYKLSLNPNANFRKAAVEALYDLTRGTTTASDYDFNVMSAEFYACVEKNNLPATGVTPLILNEWSLQTKTLATGGSASNLDFTVPPSTSKIVVMCQDSAAGSNNIVPLTKFACTDLSDQDLRSIQITYAGKNAPSTAWTSSFTTPGTSTGQNYMAQRYLDSLTAAGFVDNPGGFETFEEWQERGQIYVFDFERDAEDRSSHVQLQMLYNNIKAGTNVFICALYRRRIDITTTNGFISSVSALSI